MKTWQKRKVSVLSCLQQVISCCFLQIPLTLRDVPSSPFILTSGNNVNDALTTGSYKVPGRKWHYGEQHKTPCRSSGLRSIRKLQQMLLQGLPKLPKTTFPCCHPPYVPEQGLGTGSTDYSPHYQCTCLPTFSISVSLNHCLLKATPL